MALDALVDTWDDKYPQIRKSWRAPEHVLRIFLSADNLLSLVNIAHLKSLMHYQMILNAA